MRDCREREWEHLVHGPGKQPGSNQRALKLGTVGTSSHLWPLAFSLHPDPARVHPCGGKGLHWPAPGRVPARKSFQTKWPWCPYPPGGIPSAAPCGPHTQFFFFFFFFWRARLTSVHNESIYLYQTDKSDSNVIFFTPSLLLFAPPGLDFCKHKYVYKVIRCK